MNRLYRSGISIGLTFTALLFTVPAANAASPSSAGSPIVIGQRHQMSSTALSAPVTYLVHTPKFYDRTDRSYPVVILLDGSKHFAHVSATADFLTEQEKIPPVIVVGVDTVNRATNLSPPLPQAPNGPNGDRFLRFISEELIPEIDRTYRTRKYRVLMGHSAAGLFVVYALLEKPEVFNGYAAITPAIDRDYEPLIDSMPAFFASHKDLRADVFITVGNEGGRNLANVLRLAAQFSVKPRAQSDLRWRFTPYYDETHGSIPLHAMDQALRSIFAGCCLDETEALAVFDRGGLPAIQKHYDGVSQRMGYTVPIPRSAFAGTVGALRRANRDDEARLVLEQAMSAYPEDSEFYFVRGQLANPDRARMQEYFTKSLQASPIEYRSAIVNAYKFDADKLLPEITPSAQTLKAYAGTYRSTADSQTIRLKGSALVMSGSAGDCELRFLSELKFYCRREMGEFEKGRDGRVRSVTLHTQDYRYTLTKSK